MNTKLPNKDVVDLLAPRSPQVRNLALPARFFVFPTIPDISEQVDAQARIIGYRCGPKSADTVCMLMPTSVRVNLGHCLRNGTARSGKTFWKDWQIAPPRQAQEQGGLTECRVEISLERRDRAERGAGTEVKEMSIRRTA